MRKIAKSVILILVVLFVFWCIKEWSRYTITQEKINVEVLSSKVEVKSIYHYGRYHEDVDYVYITFKYGAYIYNDFELGEKEDFPNLKDKAELTLVLHKEFRDNIETNEFMNTYWYEGSEAKKVK